VNGEAKRHVVGGKFLERCAPSYPRPWVRRASSRPPHGSLLW
jgi:hypothetical protein